MKSDMIGVLLDLFPGERCPEIQQSHGEIVFLGTD
jgi:hypothetical protein